MFGARFKVTEVSLKGPYFGQAAWFNNFHPEKVPSAVERYQKEVSLH